MINFVFVGNLTKDAELRTFGERDVITMSLAINRKKFDGTQESTFVNCFYWLKSGAGLIPYLKKG